MIRRINQPMHEMLSIMALNLELTNWIFACTANIIKGQSRVWYALKFEIQLKTISLPKELFSVWMLYIYHSFLRLCLHLKIKEGF